MTDEEIVILLTDTLRSTFEPEKIFLFGSRAWGTPDENSDYDFLVLIRGSDENKLQREQRAYRALRSFPLPVPVDVLVRTDDEMVELSKDSKSLYSKIIKNGRQVYATE